MYFTEINQPIRPAELPIIGDPYTEISLDLLFPTKIATFTLIGKKIQLTQPLDRDAENLSHIVFQVIILYSEKSRDFEYSKNHGFRLRAW